MTPSISTNTIEQYQRVRAQTLALTAPLSDEDMAVQSMPDASPIKWHLAHTTWFFETFILAKYSADFHWFNHDYCILFNSYYESVGPQHLRPHRGMLTRPSARDIMEYRRTIDAAMIKLFADLPAEGRQEIIDLTTVGLHHEMQHQELMITDCLHLFSHNPLAPAVFPAPTTPASPPYAAEAFSMLGFTGGLVDIGHSNTQNDFAYDCEKPQHSVFAQPFKLANRPVSNADYLEFMGDGGYSNSLLWLSEGWAQVKNQQWQAPLYWQRHQEQWQQYTLHGRMPLDPHAAVCHVSYYEAEAYARWAGKRLPREYEWELAAREQTINGHFLESQTFTPQSMTATSRDAAQYLFGGVWEWTQSPFCPYPGFTPELGALGEYNGKFMANQFVLRGGSCATPKGQMRASYRNFFHPHQRWQFSGFRLAENA